MYPRSICALSMMVLALTPWLKAQSSAGESFIDEHLRPYYEHAGFSWKIEREPHFELNFEANSEAERRLSQLKDVAELGRASVLKVLGATSYDPVIHVFFVGSIARMNELIGAEVIGRSRPTQHAVFCVVAPFSELSLAHELTHEIVSNLWGPGEHWLQEGLANYVVDNNSSLMNRQCLGLLQSKQWIPLKLMVNPAWESSIYYPDDTYPELGGFVQYLYETYGVEYLQIAWTKGSKGLKKVYGKNLSKLESDWRAALVKRVGPVHDQINLPGRGDLLLQEEITHEHGINP
ncbi:MAG: hypothetical protein ABSB88_07340 [Bryobacteraceae bacterium]|jgi:hypothetical protein